MIQKVLIHAMRVRMFLIGRGTVLKTTPSNKKHAFAICKFRWSVQVLSCRDFLKPRICRKIRSKQQNSAGTKGDLLGCTSVIAIFIISFTNVYSLHLNHTKNNSKY